MAKVTITMPDDLLQELDEYADKTYTTRSGAITLMVNDYLTSRKITSGMTQVVNALERLAAGNKLSDEEREQLAGLSALAKLMQ